jgi:hypothetical protein
VRFLWREDGGGETWKLEMGNVGDDEQWSGLWV